MVSLPEVALGLFPDAGATALLQRLPGALGRWLGLTGLALTGEWMPRCLPVCVGGVRAGRRRWVSFM